MERGERGLRGDKGDRGDRGETGDRGESGEGWQDYRKLILHQLEDLTERVERMDAQNRADHAAVVSELGKVNTEIGALKVKAGFYGAVSGLGAALAIFMAQLFGLGGGRV